MKWSMQCACTWLAGILLITGLGVALGVAFGVVLLFGLLYCFRGYVSVTSQLDAVRSDPLSHSECAVAYEPGVQAVQ